MDLSSSRVLAALFFTLFINFIFPLLIPAFSGYNVDRHYTLRIDFCDSAEIWRFHPPEAPWTLADMV